MAGAHRAGTVGMAVVMRMTGLATATAAAATAAATTATPPNDDDDNHPTFAPYQATLDAARKRRPILDPDLVSRGAAVHLLQLLDGSWEEKEKRGKQSAPTASNNSGGDGGGGGNLSRGLVAAA